MILARRHMAPEQAKGFAVDKRADIWAFGVVLFEMLSGKRLFEAPTVPETLAQVLTRPPDLDALPASTPAAIGPQAAASLPGTQSEAAPARHR